MSEAPALRYEGVPESVAEDINRYIRLHAPQDLAEEVVLYDASQPPPQGKTMSVAVAAAGKSDCAGALTRPFTLEAFLQRLRNISNTSHSAQQMLGQWQLDAARRRLEHPAHVPIELTDKESALLALLLRQSPRSLERANLLQQVWAYDDSIDTRTLETHIYRLRQKLERTELGLCLQTTTEGYCWQPA